MLRSFREGWCDYNWSTVQVHCITGKILENILIQKNQSVDISESYLQYTNRKPFTSMMIRNEKLFALRVTLLINIFIFWYHYPLETFPFILLSIITRIIKNCNCFSLRLVPNINFDWSIRHEALNDMVCIFYCVFILLWIGQRAYAGFFFFFFFFFFGGGGGGGGVVCFFPFVFFNFSPFICKVGTWFCFVLFCFSFIGLFFFLRVL